ncbi:MAG: cyclopropane fatty acyl phospholipid synthase [Candidatus Paceibacterota bacterium]|jgi:cyclopropane-fatty-acyl-phospholipid synthase
MFNTKQWANKVIEPSGVVLDGPNPWDPQIKNEKLYKRVKAEGSLGLGEAYMDGWWDCEALDQFFYRVLSLEDIYKRLGLSLPVIADYVKAKVLNLQAIKRAFEVGEKHYDTGNDLFVPMLGKSLAYSCGYWKDADNLDEAQEDKYDLICRKLNLKPGQKILDIGCGWGGLARHAAKNYGVSVVGITVSKEQAKLASELCAGLPIEFRVMDYRDLKEKFDHVVSVGMFEHVGVKNYHTYMKTVRKCLKPEGLFLLHTIGSLRSGSNTDPWIAKYIFPNGMLPSLKQITNCVEGLFVVEDVHNFSADYDKTLMAWHANFEKAWPDVKKNYSEKFYRMWRYYLLCCAGTFRSRSNQLWQIVLSPRGVPGGYQSAR